MTLTCTFAFRPVGRTCDTGPSDWGFRVWQTLSSWCASPSTVRRRSSWTKRSLNTSTSLRWMPVVSWRRGTVHTKHTKVHLSAKGYVHLLCNDYNNAVNVSSRWADVLMSGHTENPGTWMHASSWLNIMHFHFAIKGIGYGLYVYFRNGREVHSRFNFTACIYWAATRIPSHRSSKTSLRTQMTGCVLFSAATAAVECDTGGVCVCWRRSCSLTCDGVCVNRSCSLTCDGVCWHRSCSLTCDGVWLCWCRFCILTHECNGVWLCVCWCRSCSLTWWRVTVCVCWCRSCSLTCGVWSRTLTWTGRPSEPGLPSKFCIRHIHTLPALWQPTGLTVAASTNWNGKERQVIGLSLWRQRVARWCR